MNEPLRPYRGPWETIFFAWAALIVPFILFIWVTMAYQSCTGQASNRAPADAEEVAAT
jgi:hypothetical protein